MRPNPRRPHARNRLRDCIAEGHCRPKHRAKKDRRRWCRGRVGIEHRWSLIPQEVHHDGRPRYRLVMVPHCAGCGVTDPWWVSPRYVSAPKTTVARRSICRLCGSDWPMVQPSDDVGDLRPGEPVVIAKRPRPASHCRCGAEGEALWNDPALAS